MSDSRRDIFKKSIGTAIGLASGLAVIRAAAAPATHTTSLIVAQRDDGSWVVFVSADGKTYQAFAVTKQNPFAGFANPPHLDVEKWYNKLDKDQYLSLIKTNFTAGINFTVDSKTNYIGEGLDQLVSAPRWSEVGAQRGPRVGTGDKRHRRTRHR